MPNDLFDWDEDDEEDLWFPVDFIPDDMGEKDIETLHDIQRMVGKPIQQIIDTFDNVAKSGRAGDMRAVRFGSGAEALLWLFRRGIFLYSQIVQFPDGSWGVAIGNSAGEADDGGEPEIDIAF